MNTETAVIIAIVLAIVMVLGVATMFNTGLDETGKSLFGENTDEDGFFNPGGPPTEFPDTGSETQESSFRGPVIYDSV